MSTLRAHILHRRFKFPRLPRTPFDVWRLKSFPAQHPTPYTCRSHAHPLKSLNKPPNSWNNKWCRSAALWPYVVLWQFDYFFVVATPESGQCVCVLALPWALLKLFMLLLNNARRFVFFDTADVSDTAIYIWEEREKRYVV